MSLLTPAQSAIFYVLDLARTASSGDPQRESLYTQACKLIRQVYFDALGLDWTELHASFNNNPQPNSRPSPWQPPPDWPSSGFMAHDLTGSGSALLPAYVPGPDVRTPSTLSPGSLAWPLGQFNYGQQASTSAFVLPPLPCPYEAGDAFLSDASLAALQATQLPDEISLASLLNTDGTSMGSLLDNDITSLGSTPEIVSPTSSDSAAYERVPSPARSHCPRKARPADASLLCSAVWTVLEKDMGRPKSLTWLMRGLNRFASDDPDFSKVLKQFKTEPHNTKTPPAYRIISAASMSMFFTFWRRATDGPGHVAQGVLIALGDPLAPTFIHEQKMLHYDFKERRFVEF